MPYVPPSRLLISTSSGDVRRIDHEYATQLTAYSVDEVRRTTSDLLQLQLASTKANIAAMFEIAQRQDQTNEYLGAIEQTVNTLARGVTAVHDELEAVNANLSSINMTLGAGFSVVAKALGNIELRLVAESKQLAEISRLLTNRYETESRELRNKAEQRLKEGIRSSDRDQAEYWRHAIRLIELTLQNPIGHEDYVAWFHLGWLRWKFEADFNAAESAFDKARLLSASEGDSYHLKSLRHLAYMQYLQGKFDEAYATIQRALAVSRDHETMYDAARYAARTGRNAETLDLLSQCIDAEPTTFGIMFSEEDFTGLR